MDTHSASELPDGDYAIDQVELTPAELAGIDEAIADFEENGGIPFEEVQAWLDSLDTDHPLPEPQPRKF